MRTPLSPLVYALLASFCRRLLVCAFSTTSENEYTHWLSSNGDKYERSATLSGTAHPSSTDDDVDVDVDVALHWTIDGDRIRLAVASEAKGWLGFGIAEVGGMPGADIVLFSPNGQASAAGETEAQPRLIDAFATGYEAPIEDDCEGDWTLHAHSSEGGFVIFEASRVLDTGDDSQDRAFLDDSDPFSQATAVIAAWGDDGDLSYHGPQNRVKGAVRFFGTLGGDADEMLSETITSESEASLDLRADNFALSGETTKYTNFCFNYVDLVNLGLPADDVDRHIIGFIPDLDKNEFVHHITVKASESPTGCRKRESNSLLHLLVWFPGNPPVVLPKEAGFLLGEGGFKSIQLGIHYNNPKQVQGVVDDSGVRMLYTSQLRPHNAGILTLADIFVNLHGRPVGDGYSKHTFACPSSCTQSAFAENVTVFNEHLHMHSNGLRMTNTVMRRGAIVHEGHVDYYDFDQEGGHTVHQQSFTIQKGDEFRTTCYYKSEPTVTFGLGSSDEMCIAYLFYYPRQNVPRGRCYYPSGKRQAGACVTNYVKEAITGPDDIGRLFGKPHECLSQSSEDVDLPSVDLRTTDAVVHLPQSSPTAEGAIGGSNHPKRKSFSEAIYVLMAVFGVCCYAGLVLLLFKPSNPSS